MKNSDIYSIIEPTGTVKRFFLIKILFLGDDCLYMKYSCELIGEKIKTERVRKGWSQEQLGDRIHLSNRQISKYEKGTTLPPLETLLDLCELFDCELGYLLGEEDYSEGTRADTFLPKELGLSLEAIHAIQRITGKRNDEILTIHSKFEPDIMNHILCKLLTANAFAQILDAMFELEENYKMKENSFQSLNEKYGKNMVNKICDIYISKDPLDEIEQSLSDQEIELYKKFESTIDTQYNHAMMTKYYRYNLSEAYSELILELYPRV